MAKTTAAVLLLLLGESLVGAFSFFTPYASQGKTATKTTPKWDEATEKWIQAPGDDGEYPYDPVGSLLRHGPFPFVKRLTDPNGYEQDVLGYMAKAGVSRAEATGNMDARANNAADWMFQKMEEKNGKPKVDYTRLDKKQAALTGIWALGITPLAISVVLETVTQWGTNRPPMN